LFKGGKQGRELEPSDPKKKKQDDVLDWGSGLFAEVKRHNWNHMIQSSSGDAIGD
jgi:hypothetical protein